MAKKITTISIFPADKKPFREIAKDLLDFGDTEPVLFHKFLIDYTKLKNKVK